MQTSVTGTARSRLRTASLERFMMYEHVSVSSMYRAILGLPLLYGQVLDVRHERIRCDGTALEVRPPIRRAGRQDHILTLFANEHFVGAELKLFRQPHRLASVVHEHLGSSLHRGTSIDAVYISICHNP